MKRFILAAIAAASVGSGSGIGATSACCAPSIVDAQSATKSGRTITYNFDLFCGNEPIEQCCYWIEFRFVRNPSGYSQTVPKVKYFTPSCFGGVYAPTATLDAGAPTGNYTFYATIYPCGGADGCGAAPATGFSTYATNFTF